MLRSFGGNRAGRVAFICTAFLASTSAAGFVAAETARADVSVNAIEPSTMACGSPAKVGVWYQSFSGGPRWATIEIESASGAVVWKKSVNATTSWQYWDYHGSCGASYTVVYKTAGGTERFPFHVR